MGHRRLSIIDLSDAANQPFSGPSGRYVLSFNGEIYNYLELREELSHSSVSFRTNSDTEVMVAALEQWQDNALGRFDGMFAGALHDRETGRHLLFRDPLGQKLLAERVAEQQVTTRFTIMKRTGKHAVKTAKCIVLPLFQGSDHNLGIAVCAKRYAAM